MKKLLVITLTLFLGYSLIAQEAKTDKVLFKMPSVNVVDLNGKKSIHPNSAIRANPILSASGPPGASLV